MMRSLNTAATGMVAQQMNLDVIANNLANVNTTGFKGQHAEFQDLMYQVFRPAGAQTGTGGGRSPQASQIGLGTKFVSSPTNFSPGSIAASSSPLDVSINGDGFFQVQMADGTTAYTRDGSFKVDADGQVVTSDGYKVVPNISLGTGYRQLTISGSGQISAVLAGNNDPTDIGKIKVVIFPNQGGLTRLGQNLYAAGVGSGQPSEQAPGENGAGSLQQGFLEGSNIQVVEEMVRMITAQRAYEINSKAIQTSDEMLSTLNNLKR